MVNIFSKILFSKQLLCFVITVQCIDIISSARHNPCMHSDTAQIVR